MTVGDHGDQSGSHDSDPGQSGSPSAVAARANIWDRGSACMQASVVHDALARMASPYWPALTGVSYGPAQPIDSITAP